MAETIADPLLGRLIDGRYEVRERVAAGGMSTVYIAMDRRLERSVAIKIIHTAFPGNSDPHEFASRVRREAKAAARLTHPGLVRVYDQGTDGDIAYLTMEYIEGENLRARLTHEATLSVGEALGVTESVLDALAAAHRQGLVHRDVKPENVLIDDAGVPKLADFGLARAITEVTATSTGTIMGTVAYLSPELISRGHADARSDVYACGILLYEMITGRQPYVAPSAIEVAALHVQQDMPAPSIVVPWLPPEIDELVTLLTARDPNERPADATVALGRLRQTRAMIDDPTLDRRADPPSGTIPVLDDNGNTTVLEPIAAGSTVAVPIGLGSPLVHPGELDADVLDDDPEAVTPQRDRARPVVWILGILAAILLVGGLGGWWYATQGPGAYSTVPPVAGFTSEEAQSILDSAGFGVDVQGENSDDVAEGFAIGTDPEAQAQVPNGDTITLIVSLGPRMETMPEVAGVLEVDALKRIEDAGFSEVGETVRVHDDEVPLGEVISSDPAAGETVPHSTPIVLTVSMGPAPIVVPDVVGLAEADAVAQLREEYGLDVAVVYERTLEQPKGAVFKTDPAAGTDGVRTQPITVFVSDGKPLITVPDYIAQEVDVAVADAEELGFEVRLESNRPWSQRRWIVDQDLEPNSTVEVGTVLTLYYN